MKGNDDLAGGAEGVSFCISLFLPDIYPCAAVWLTSDGSDSWLSHLNREGCTVERR